MKLGNLSAKYESNGDPGCIARTSGDAGGTSYGAYQFSQTSNIPQRFVEFLLAKDNLFGYTLNEYYPDTPGFDEAWEQIATEYPNEFLDEQHEFVRENYYLPACERAREVGINLENHSFALQNVVWSASVQYGVYYVGELFEDACDILGYPNPSYVDAENFDRDLIKAIYDVRASDEWTAGSPSLRYGLRNRFSQECDDALAILESGYEC